MGARVRDRRRRRVRAEEIGDAREDLDPHVGADREVAVAVVVARVVLASEIASLPDLTGYLAFAGNHPIAKVKLDVVRFRNRVPAFEERLAC